MHNTSTENNIMKWQLNTYLYLFRGHTPSWVFSFIVFFIHDSIISYPNAEVDKKFFKSWDLQIPHCLRDLLWMMRAWSSVSSISPSLLMNQASSSCWNVITSFWNTFLEWMNSTILGGHSRWPLPLLHSSLFILILQVVFYFIWETLMTPWSLHSRSTHSSTGFFRSYSNFCSSLQIAWNSGIALLAIGSAL